MLGEPPSRIQMPGTFFVEKLQTPDGGEDFFVDLPRVLLVH